MTRIRVSPAPARLADYDVTIEPGALQRVVQIAREAAPAYRYAIISDSNVARLHGESVRRAFADAAVPAELFEFEAGEANKTRASWGWLSDELLARGYGRDACIIALGGGVTGDLGGFIAATYLRGIPVVQVPTSLLAMVDASIGGKTGVDTPHGKNMIGAFHQPAAVIIDPEVLRTLPAAEFRAGLAEAIKHAAIVDSDYMQAIERDREQLAARDAHALEQLVRRSVEIKAGIVARDPLENGERKSLNFGHTIGHAVEALSQYSLAHGFAVAIGMVAEARIGEGMQVTEAGTADRLAGILASFELQTAVPADADAISILELAARDKKAREGRIQTTLIARIGEVARNEGRWTFPLDMHSVRRALVTIPPSV
jgi:3-dehydroquinate synthase